MQTPTHFGEFGPGGRPLRAFLAFLLLFFGLGASQIALGQSQNNNSITLSQQPTNFASQSVNYAGATTNDPFSNYPRLGDADTGTPTPQAGVYDLDNRSQLILTGGTIMLEQPRFNRVVSAQLLYRVSLVGAATTAFSVLQLPASGTISRTDAGGNAYTESIYTVTNATVDLLKNVASGGSYTLEVKFQGTRSDGNKATDPAGSYTLNFTVTAPLITPPGGTTTWISNRDENGIVQGLPGSSTLGVDSDWLKAANWSNGVPTTLSDAIIPGHGPKDPQTFRPSLDDPNSLYVVRNLTLQNPSTGDRGIVRLGAATLRIYGNLENLAGGLLAGTIGSELGVADPQKNSTIVFAGDNQIIKGLTTIPDIRIEGTGIKGVANKLEARNTLIFAPASAPAGVILRTVFDDGLFNLNTSKTATIDLKDSGLLSGETNTSYVDGILLADRSVIAGEQQTFGNIGLDYIANQNSNGNLTVTRTVGVALNGPVGTGSKAIKRFYGVTGTYPSNTVGNIVFHYLGTDDELNTVLETNLALFKTVNGAAPYQPLNGTVDLVKKTVTRLAFTGVLNTVTLGDKLNPLPVSLTVFNAARSGADALITWETATERDNKGFFVEVSVDGKSFRSLSFVASHSPNSSERQSYQFVDAEAGKSGNRYYRLNQVDLNGKATLSPVRVLDFGVAAASSTLVALPNPFTNNVSISIGGTGTATLRLLDLTGRTLRVQQARLENVAGKISLENLDGLNAGVYLVQLTLPSGKVQSFKMQKQ